MRLSAALAILVTVALTFTTALPIPIPVADDDDKAALTSPHDTIQTLRCVRHCVDVSED